MKNTKIIFFDIDGTLIDVDTKKVTPKMLETLRRLKEKGIIYAPGFLINAGGVINVYSELANLTSAQVIEKTENIYNTAMDIFNLSDVQNITTHQAALNIAQKRIDDRKKELQNK